MAEIEVIYDDDLVTVNVSECDCNAGAFDCADLIGCDISKLTNDAGYLASGDNVSELVNDSGYLTTINGLNISLLNNDSGYLTTINGLNISLLNNDSGYLTTINGLNISLLNNDSGYLTTISGLNISQLTNDSGYITSAALSGYVPTSRTLTINGVAFDLSADRTWTISSTGWGLLGNAGTVAATNFVGTTDAIGLQFRTNNVPRLTLGATNFNMELGSNTSHVGLLSVSANSTGNPATGRSIEAYGQIWGYSNSNAALALFNGTRYFTIGYIGTTQAVIYTGNTGGVAPAMYFNDAFGSNGNISIGATPNASAKFAVTSTTGGFLLTPMTATQASAITPVEGLELNVSNTNGTFTSIGKWQYIGGAWVKL